MFEIIAFAIAFYIAWSIGANDSANSLGAVIGSKVLTFERAIIIACIFGFIGAMFLSNPVSKTIGSGIVEPLDLTADVLILLATAILLTFASFFGLPLSTTQAIIGVAIGWGFVSQARLNFLLIGNVVISWIITPTVAIIGGALVYLFVKKILKNLITSMVQKERWEARFALLQIPALIILALAYTANDIPNAVGIFYTQKLFGWILLSSSFGFVFGMLTFGKKVLYTVSRKLVTREMSTAQGFVIQLTAGLIVLIFTLLGMPISTTQVTVGVILGTGLAGGLSRVNWSIIAEVIASWVLTIPIGFALGFAFGTIF
jgi:PiT family inorganic phosphate transporter